MSDVGGRMSGVNVGKLRGDNSRSLSEVVQFI